MFDLQPIICIQGAFSLVSKLQWGIAIHIVFATALAAAMAAHDADIYSRLELQ